MKFLRDLQVFHINMQIVLLRIIKTMKHVHKLMNMREIKIDLVSLTWKFPDQVFQIQPISH